MNLVLELRVSVKPARPGHTGNLKFGNFHVIIIEIASLQHTWPNFWLAKTKT